VKYDKRLLLLELRSMECPGIGNYKRPRIFRGISHTSTVVVPQTLELLEGWKSWRWEISEVSLYDTAQYGTARHSSAGEHNTIKFT